MVDTLLTNFVNTENKFGEKNTFGNIIIFYITNYCSFFPLLMVRATPRGFGPFHIFVNSKLGKLNSLRERFR